MGLNSSKRKLSGTLNCPTTADSRVIKKILSFPILPRNSIERLPHVIFLGSFNEIRAWKNLSGLTLYFTERKARYSPNGKFLCLEPYALRAFAVTPSRKSEKCRLLRVYPFSGRTQWQLFKRALSILTYSKSRLSRVYS